MRNTKTLTVGTLAFALAAVLGMGVLAGCSQGSTGDTAATETQEAETDETADDEAAAATEEAATDEAAKETADAGPVWVMTRRSQVYTNKSDDTPSTTTFTYELDEHGNYTTETMDFGDGIDPIVSTHTYDENGFPLSTKGESEEITYTSEVDDQGRLVKLVGSDGTTQAYSYNADGNIEMSSATGTYYNQDEDGNRVEGGTYTTIYRYDAEGLPVEFSFEGEIAYTNKFSYERDDSGKIVGCLVESDGGEEVGGDWSSTIEADENGNFVRITEDTESYSMETTIEYTQVEDPSAWVRANAAIKTM